MAGTQGRLIIVCGLPGSGKTTTARALAEQSSGIVFSPDDWMDVLAIDIWSLDGRRRTEQLQWQVARQVLAIGGTAIIEWGTWARQERDELRLGARELGAAAELIYLTAEPEVLFERIDRRGREKPPITLEMMREWAGAIEAPTPEEFTLFDPPTEPLP